MQVFPLDIRPAAHGDREAAPRSCRGWYQADRQPGAWQCTTR
jgi:hypothetical protein